MEGTDAAADDPVHLKRRVGLFSGVALIVGTMIGQYIYNLLKYVFASNDSSHCEIRQTVLRLQKLASQNEKCSHTYIYRKNVTFLSIQLGKN